METLNRVFNFASVISTFVILFKLALQGVLSVETTVVFLIIIVFIVARHEMFYKLLAALAGLLYFVWEKSGFNKPHFLQLLQPMLALVIMLFGIYILFGGLNSSKNSNGHKRH